MELVSYLSNKFKLLQITHFYLTPFILSLFEVETFLKQFLFLEIMEVMENLKMDNLVILEPIVEGDIVRVSDHPGMDGMNIVEFDDEVK